MVSLSTPRALNLSHRFKGFAYERQLSKSVINKIMNEQEDEFFVEPEIQQVHDIQPINEANPLTEKLSPEEPKYIPLKMVEIPKTQQTYNYKPFHFQHQEEDESDEEDFQDTSESPFSEYYDPDQCVYQKYHNQQFNRLNGTVYFSGAFLHQNIFLDGNYSETHDLQNITRQYYDKNEAQLPSPKCSDLRFDSRFESGNLFAAFKIKENEYDLIMSNDINSTGNNQWFYFSVEGMTPDRDYIFNVINFTKSDSLFNYGMAPAIYSMAENKNVFGLDKGWRRAGKEVSYRKGQIHREGSRRMYYRLTFKLQTLFEDDKIFIAHSFPYTTLKLNNFISDKSTKHKDIVTRVNIGKTLSKRTIEGLILAYNLNKKKKDTRKAIFILARQHPGETQGSYVCQGVVERLVSKAKEGEFLLKNYIFYVIPMVNPDGVVFGHYRTNLSGKDLNRKWNASEKETSCPEVTSIKNFIQEVSKQRDIRFIIDLHGHSKKLNSFFYGNPCPENPDVVRIFPYTCSKLHSGVQFLDCTFATEQYKRKAARVYLSFLYRLVHVYTFQSSFYAYFKEGKKVQFTPKEYRQLGGTLINALFLQLEHQIKFQQSFQFSFNKKTATKEYLNSPFMKLVSQLKNNKDLLEWGGKNQSGSESKPEEGEINNEQMDKFKPQARPLSTKTEDPNQSAKSSKTSRKGTRQTRELSFNKPIRNIKFLEISRVNSILPDKYQLGLQPTRKKEVVSELVPKPQTAYLKVGAQSQTQPKPELKIVEFRHNQIENCVLSNSVKVDTSPQRKFSSVIRSNNRNIIFKFDIFGHTTTRQEDLKPPKAPLIYKHAYSQTLITYSKEQGDKIKTSQMLPQMETPERKDLKWARNNSIRVESSMKNGIRREAELFFNGMVKKFMTEKQPIRASDAYQTKFSIEKPLNIKKKEIYKK